MPGSCKEVFFRGLLTNPVSGKFGYELPGNPVIEISFNTFEIVLLLFSSLRSVLFETNPANSSSNKTQIRTNGVTRIFAYWRPF